MDKITIGNLISSVNEKHPNLIELDPFIWGFESHGSETHINIAEEIANFTNDHGGNAIKVSRSEISAKKDRFHKVSPYESTINIHAS